HRSDRKPLIFSVITFTRAGLTWPRNDGAFSGRVQRLYEQEPGEALTLPPDQCVCGTLGSGSLGQGCRLPDLLQARTWHFISPFVLLERPNVTAAVGTPDPALVVQCTGEGVGAW